MQRKALNYTADDAAFRRRIRTQPLLEAAKESQQLGNHDKYDRSVVVSEFAEPTDTESLHRRRAQLSRGRLRRRSLYRAPAFSGPVPSKGPVRRHASSYPMTIGTPPGCLRGQSSWGRVGSPRNDSHTVVTRPEVISSIFKDASRAAEKRVPLPRNTARRNSVAAIVARTSK
jgi:hypothetical protein